MPQPLILIVEDEPGLSEVLEKYLQHSDFRTHIIDQGLEVEPWVAAHEPNLILLDRMLPGKDGIAICQSIRRDNDVPIIMVTALQEEDDRLLGIEVGADDYICKPFSAREVVARVKMVLRRVQPAQPEDAFIFDESNQRVSANNQDLGLTSVEYRLLKLLSSDTSEIFSRADIMVAIYDDHRVVSDRSIDSHVKNLRKKIDAIGTTGRTIKSIYGRGYQLQETVLD